MKPIARRCGALVLTAGALLAACSNEHAADTRFLSIATGGTGGVYYPYGGGLAKILSEHLPGVRATAEVTAASVDNLKLVRDGRADVAFTLADTLADAVAGKGAFEGQPVDAVSLAVLYSNYTHVVVSAASGIRAIPDLRGHTVSTGSPGSGTEVVAMRILHAAGLDPDRDLRRQRLGASESAEALKDGKVAGFFWSGGLPTAAVQDLSHTPGVTVRLLPTLALIESLNRTHGELYFPLEIPPSIYPGVDSAVPVVGVANVLVVNRSMPDELAYGIARVMFEQQAALAAIHPEARNLTLQSARKGSPAAFHPGAVRYYREQGVW